MELAEMIYRRKSTRSYTGEPVEEELLNKIKAFSDNLRPLYSDIKVCAEIVTRDQVSCIMPWTTPQLISIFSEDKDGALENVGFMFQQLELYMQSLGLGVCWLGMGKLNTQGTITTQSDDGLKFVIMLAFGYPKGDTLRKNGAEFKRKSLTEISDEADERLEPARLAPSSINSQPWYFVHEGDIIHAYCVMQGFFKAKALGTMNRIDMGIALAQMYISNSDTFKFFKADKVKEIKGYGYIGSFIL